MSLFQPFVRQLHSYHEQCAWKRDQRHANKDFLKPTLWGCAYKSHGLEAYDEEFKKNWDYNKDTGRPEKTKNWLKNEYVVGFANQ